MWSVGAESVDSPDAVALLGDYFAELTVRYFHRATTDEEIDETLDEFPSNGLALFLLLRAGGEPVGCLCLHPTGEITRLYVSPRFRRRGGARALLTAAESWARNQGITRLFLDTRTDLVEARAFYASCGFVEIPPTTSSPGPFQDHWFEKPLTSPGELALSLGQRDGRPLSHRRGGERTSPLLAPAASTAGQQADEERPERAGYQDDRGDARFAGG